MATPTSGAAAAQQNGTAKTSGGKKRHVASQAGVTRYGKPIGSEIGGPRDANHAAIQSDQGARGNYGKLISGDAKAQRSALDGMSTEDLNKLADISFSFKSANPQVVALRIAARNAQARRGIHVKVGQTQTNPTAAKKAPSKGMVHAMANRVGPASRRLVELANAAEEHTASTGSFPVPDVAHVRKAISAIERARPEQRPIIARHIIARARALNCEHLISDAIRHYARGHREPGTVGMSRAQQQEIELAGRWKHGYIPLDSVAMSEKMKGRTGGKKWWGDSTRGGVSGNLKPHGSPKSGSAKPERHGGPVRNPHQSSPEQKALGQQERRQRQEESAKARAPKLNLQPRHAPASDAQLQARRANAKRVEDQATAARKTGQDTEAAIKRMTAGDSNIRREGGSTKLTKMVKSGFADSKPRGAKVDTSKLETPAGKSPTAFGAEYVQKHGAEKARAEAAKLRAGSPDKTDLRLAVALESAAGKPKPGNMRIGDHEYRNMSDVNVPKPGDKQDTTDKSKLAWASDYRTPGQVHAAVASGKITPAQGNALLEDMGRAAAPKSRTIPDKPATDAPVRLTPKTREALQNAGPDGTVTFRTSNQGLLLEGQGLVHRPGGRGPFLITEKGRKAARQDAPAPKRKSTSRDTTHDGKLVQQGYIPPGQGSDPNYEPKGPTASAQSKSEQTALENGRRYIEMHGTDGARKKVAALEARASLSSLERKSLAGLEAALAGGDGGSGKA